MRPRNREANMGMKGLARLRAFTRISPAAVLAAAIAAAAAAALTVVPVAPGAAVSDSTPFTYMGTNPCNGEDFIGAGTLHMVMSENVSATGGLISHIDFSIDGLHAVTLDG